MTSIKKKIIVLILIRLVRIRPICLPVNEPVRTRSFVNYQPFVAGWGRLQEGGKSSNVLQELQLPVLDNSECKEQYRKQGKLISENQFGDAVICAGVLTGGHDSCQGDSGRVPFINNFTIFIITNLISFNSNRWANDATNL